MDVSLAFLGWKQIFSFGPGLSFVRFLNPKSDQGIRNGITGIQKDFAEEA